jgi:DNA-binding NarL/FixJ family response regulator
MGHVELRIAVVATDPSRRSSLVQELRQKHNVEVTAWAESVAALIVLGTRAAICLSDTAPTSAQAATLAGRGCTIVVLSEDSDATAALARAATADRAVTTRPHLAPRQLEVLIAYVATSDLLPTVARQLGMDTETVKTHLRRIRVKYLQVGRPAPTRRDLYVRAVEDGLLAPPEDRTRH